MSTLLFAALAVGLFVLSDDRKRELEARHYRAGYLRGQLDVAVDCNCKKCKKVQKHLHDDES